MTPAPSDHVTDALAFERRQKRIQTIAWAATLLPFLAFGFLTWQSAQIERHNQDLQRQTKAQTETKAQLDAEIAGLQRERDRLREDKVHYRGLAGVRVVFYRTEDSQLVASAMAKLGLQTELRKVRKIGKRADTLAYGPEVSVGDCKAVAKALVEAGFPLRGIRAAENVREARMLQIYASELTSDTAPVFTVDRIGREAVCGQQ